MIEGIRIGFALLTLMLTGLGPKPAATRCGACHAEAMPSGSGAKRASTGRLEPPLFGWGLLAAIPESTLEAMAGPADRNGDGISGRLSRVDDVVTGSTPLYPDHDRAGITAELSELALS